ncbi:MAG: enzyme of heme biosynthesis [Methylococcaceae bacterium]|nr:enzyme of heme biosynthesis [Methylococcaceae bacterium]
MAEEVTEKQQQDEAVTEQVAEQVTVIEKKSKAGLWLIIIILLIILLASAGFYFLLELRDKQEAQSGQISKEDQRAIELTKQITNTQSQIAAMQSQLATFGADVTGSDDVFNKKLAEFSALHNEKLEMTQAELKQNILQVQRQLGKTRGDWLMADAEYLLSVANQRLHLVGDLKTTREALKAADQRLHESGDAAAFKVRAQIAKEISALKTVPESDVVGSYATLQQLIDKVDSLSLLLPYAGKPLTPSKEVHSHAKNSKDSHGILDLALKQVEGYVTIRHADQSVDEILTPLQAQFIKQQLSIKLEMVKIALVQKNKALYKTSITDATKWLNEHFTKNEIAKDFIKEFNTLNTIQIHTELPDISRSLKMLRDISKLRIETDKGLQEDDKAETTKPEVVKPEVIKPTPEKSENSTESVVNKDADVSTENSTPEATVETVAEKKETAPSSEEKTPPKADETTPAAVEKTDEADKITSSAEEVVSETPPSTAETTAVEQ